MFGASESEDATATTEGSVAVGSAVEGAVGPLDAATAALARAVDGLLAVEPGDVADGELAEAMVGLRRLQARLAAVVAGHTAVFDARGVYAGDGSRSATDWIAVHARLPRPQVAGEVRDARRLASMPLTRAALGAGDISAAHVRVLARLAGHPRAGAAFPDGEAHLVDQARRARFDDWDRLCSYWRDAADPDGPEQRHGRDQDLRRFRLGVGLDGVGHPDGYLTPVATATLTGALERIEAELFTADWAAAKQIHGDHVTVAHLARTAAQRRHDALLEMAVRASTAPADGTRPAPLVTVMVDYPTFAGRVCELAAGTVIAPGAVAELLGHDDTLIQRVIGDGPNRIRDISTARSFRGTLRRILDITHRRCDHTTCFVPAHRCQGDHITPWSHGGPTTQTNGRLACGPHNRWWYTTRHNPPPADPPPPQIDDHGPDNEPPPRPDPPPLPVDDDELDDASPPDPDPVDPLPHTTEPPPPPPDAAAPPPAPRVLLRIAVTPPPDLHTGHGDSPHTIHLRPRTRHTSRRWRDYPAGPAA